MLNKQVCNFVIKYEKSWSLEHLNENFVMQTLNENF